jgi:uracil-DNA glycosylase
VSLPSNGDGGKDPHLLHVEIEKLHQQIVACRQCERLVDFREAIAREKRKQFADYDYWGKPVPGFGDPNAELIVVGLAPAAHGGNRTGRVFTGDNSARFLVKHLHKAGFASQPTSESREDGLSYLNCYVTAAVRCVPPDNKPTADEISKCSSFFAKELELLPTKRAILALGKIAFDSTVSFAKSRYDIQGRHEFKHGGVYFLDPKFPVIYASYHPSPRNVNTGKLTSRMFSSVLRNVKKNLNQNNRIATAPPQVRSRKAC